MQKGYTPAINYVSEDDGYPNTKVFDVVFTNSAAARNYAEMNFGQHFEARAITNELLIFDTAEEAQAHQRNILIERAKTKLTLDEREALGID